jgi:hypothetical protein
MSIEGVPIFGASIDFSDGATFITTSFVLDDTTNGKLGTGQLADTSVRVDISSLCVSASIRRGRNRILDKFEAGTATVVLKDSTGDFNPSNSSGAYYGKLTPLRKIQIFADYNGTRYPLFYGFIVSYTTNFQVGIDSVSQVTLQCADGFRLMNNVVFTSLPAASAGDSTGTRINQLLDLAGWPSVQRSIDNGDTTCQTDPGTANRNILDALQLVGDKTEFGGFFADFHGSFQFLSRSKLAAQASSPQVTYTDDNSGIGYQTIELMHDDVLVVNNVSVNKLGGAIQQVSDSDSISTYFTHSGLRQDILVQTDAEALSQAQMLLATRKDATLRISSLSLNLFDPTDSPRIIAGLGSDIFNPIQVIKTMPGSTSITKILLIQGIQHDMSKSSFNTKLITAEPVIKGFVLNSSLAGVLDGTEGLLSY